MNYTPSAFTQNLIWQAAAPYQPAGPYTRFFAQGMLAGYPAFAHLLSAGLLQKLGFEVEGLPMSQGTPFSTVLLVAQLQPTP